MVWNLIQLGPALQKIAINIQCKTITKIYNEIKKEHPVHGLGESKVITKKRRIIAIQKKLKNPIDKMITVIPLNHSITCFNHYIFDSTQTYAVYRMEENLKYILGNPFTVSHDIEYKHNCGILG